jgi:hypothetical protein
LTFSTPRCPSTTRRPAAGEDSIDLARLGSEDWIVGSPGTSCYDVVMVACGAAGSTPRAIHFTSDWVARRSSGS